MSSMQWLVELVNRKPSPARIPVAGDEGKLKLRDYFDLTLTSKTNNSSYSFVEWNAAGISVKEWGEAQNAYMTSTLIPMSDLEAYKPDVTFYYRRHEFRFTSAKRLRIFYALRIHIISDWKRKVAQSIYNARSLASVERTELMSEIAARYMADARFRPNEWTRLGERHGARVVRHPDFHSMVRRERILLDSLVETGELKEANGNFQVSPALFATLDRIATEERRHNQGVEIQRLVILIAFATLVASAVQAWAAYAGLHNVGQAETESRDHRAQGGQR